MAMTHSGWMDAAAEEYRRIDRLLGGLCPDDWSVATDCPGWDVRDVVAHLIGAAEATASVRERVHQLWAAARIRRKGQLLIDGMNAVQVSERADWTPDQLRSTLAEAGIRSVRARRRTPAPVRAVRLPFGQPLGVRPLGYLLDRVYTRDAWMHRVDLARATGHFMEVTPGHDGRIVDDAVDEWADTHRQPFALQLTGAAGGTWSRGSDGITLTLDAIEFCRLLSGRGHPTGLLAHPVTF